MSISAVRVERGGGDFRFRCIGGCSFRRRLIWLGLSRRRRRRRNLCRCVFGRGLFLEVFTKARIELLCRIVTVRTTPEPAHFELCRDQEQYSKKDIRTSNHSRTPGAMDRRCCQRTLQRLRRKSSCRFSSGAKPHRAQLGVPQLLRLSRSLPCETTRVRRVKLCEHFALQTWLPVCDLPESFMRDNY